MTQINQHVDAIVNEITATITAKLSNQIRDIVRAEVVKAPGAVTGTISGDQIRGGIIQEFGSTGIDDRATSCMLTVTDETTVVENNLLTQDLTVQGQLTVNGTISEDSALFQQITRAVTAKLPKAAPAAPAADPNAGLLPKLQVEGNSYLTRTLYVTNGRVGVNTINPVAAFTLVDEEVGFTISKLRTETAHLSAPGLLTMVLSSNYKEQITLKPNGETIVKELTIGKNRIISSDRQPAESAAKGTIVLNSNPESGGYIGWISLGIGNWAKFGLIE